mmetsp:Transcript_18342/g.28788  ORF Transcript_18342/g.28788 Transcript_18342/m.28788 type:complete len:201 (+) Transcript_18342:906-1508(+)
MPTSRQLSAVSKSFYAWIRKINAARNECRRRTRLVKRHLWHRCTSQADDRETAQKEKLKNRSRFLRISLPSHLWLLLAVGRAIPFFLLYRRILISVFINHFRLLSLLPLEPFHMLPNAIAGILRRVVPAWQHLQDRNAKGCIIYRILIGLKSETIVCKKREGNRIITVGLTYQLHRNLRWPALQLLMKRCSMTTRETQLL